MKYLSREWKDAQWEAFEETQIGDDTSDCGGWTMDNPPCGGCASCLRMQFGHYMHVEEQAVRTLQRAGFDVAAPEVCPKIEWTGHHKMPYHDSWNHLMAGEKS